MEQPGACDVGYAGIVLTTRQARRIAEGGATMHLSFKYMRAIAEGTQAVICSKYCYQGVCLLRLHAVVTFLGNRFIYQTLALKVLAVSIACQCLSTKR